jgi:hypothetical protein
MHKLFYFILCAVFGLSQSGCVSKTVDTATPIQQSKPSLAEDISAFDEAENSSRKETGSESTSHVDSFAGSLPVVAAIVVLFQLGSHETAEKNDLIFGNCKVLLPKNNRLPCLDTYIRFKELNGTNDTIVWVDGNGEFEFHLKPQTSYVLTAISDRYNARSEAVLAPHAGKVRLRINLR